MPPQRGLQPPLPNHIYIKKWVSATSATNRSFVMLQQHCWPLRNYFGSTRNKKGQRTTSTSVITDIPLSAYSSQLNSCDLAASLNFWTWSKASRLSHQAVKPWTAKHMWTGRFSSESEDCHTSTSYFILFPNCICFNKNFFANLAHVIKCHHFFVRVTQSD